MLEKVRALNVIQKLALVAAFFTVFAKPLFYSKNLYTDEETMIWLATIATFILIAVLFGDKKAD